MIDENMKAILIKTSTLGLYPDRHLGKYLHEVLPDLLELVCIFYLT